MAARAMSDLLSYPVLHSASLLSVAIASFLGSLHCIGMCGGLVLLAGSGDRSPAVGQVVYHGGRALGYLVLGLLAGGFGEVFSESIGAVLSQQQKFSPLIVAVLFFVMWGVVNLLARGREQRTTQISSPTQTISFLENIRVRSGRFYPLALGVFTAVLPCPWLYSFVVLAAATTSPLQGAKVMVVFWLGTLPALFVAGTVFEKSLRVFLGKYPRARLWGIVLAVLLSVAAHFGGGLHAHHAADPAACQR